MLEFPQPAITKSRTAEAGANSRRARRGKPTRIGPSYNPVRLSGRAKAKCYFRSPVLAVREQVCLEQVLAVRLLLRRPCRGKLMARLLIALGSPSTSKQLRRSRNYFFLRSFFDSPFDSLASVRQGDILPVRLRRKLFPTQPCLRRDGAYQTTRLPYAVVLRNSLPL